VNKNVSVRQPKLSLEVMSKLKPSRHRKSILQRSSATWQPACTGLGLGIYRLSLLCSSIGRLRASGDLPATVTRDDTNDADPVVETPTSKKLKFLADIDVDQVPGT